ncbi:MAG: Unknown protein [uncultured Campylobacterales bacterium]|uniref:Uncharacterized protein n=1 Tax=uncultured Campylobacterales bacterium TaxID=352960 RepID=A0A6S6TFV9_9BACT|nr:MAG: Unknown protein [uncultured Campylobacterales bacterium]
MKKFRGKKRYYKNLFNKDLDRYFNHLNFDSWFDLWHDHIDWCGYGNISWKHYKQHLEVLLVRFEYLTKRLENRDGEYQLFCLIDINNSMENTIFIHTQNPNKSEFPINYQSGNLEISNNLEDFLVRHKYEWFQNNEKLIFIYDIQNGISIKKD